MGDFLLEPPTNVAPATPPPAAPSARPATLAGIDWQEVAGEARGEVALVEIASGEGELQTWEPRGVAG